MEPFRMLQEVVYNFVKPAIKTGSDVCLLCRRIFWFIEKWCSLLGLDCKAQTPHARV